MNLSTDPLSELMTVINDLKFKSEIDKQFFNRVYSTPRNIYLERLAIIEFEKKDLVLDAGCGFGQWTLALSELNKNITAIDSDYKKIEIGKKISKFYKRENISFLVGSVETHPFRDNEFDAIFSYSVIYWTEFKKTIKEFYRILKPGGKLYLVANGIGWSILNILTGHSSAPGFNSRIYSINTILSTIFYRIAGKRKHGQAIFLSPSFLSKYLSSVGFQSIKQSSEGYLRINKNKNLHPFYKKKFLGLTNVFEIWAEK